MPIDTDMIAMLFGPFGDIYRHDKRQPFVAEGYVDINPDDAKSLGIEDGDYVWIDSDPADRPFRGWQKNDKDYKFARLLCRARYYPGTPRGVTRMWFNMYGATPGSRGRARDARGRSGQESAQPLPGDVPLRLAPVRDPRLAEADLDDRFAGAQGSLRPGDQQGFSARRSLSHRRPARGDRQDHQSRAGRDRTARDSGARRRLGYGRNTSAIA